MFEVIKVALPGCRYAHSSALNILEEAGAEVLKVCVFMHGSTGLSDISMAYVNFMASLGFLVVCPCSKKVEYNSTAQHVCTSSYQQLYKSVLISRIKTLNKALKMATTRFPNANLVAMGTSEGGIAVARCKSPVALSMKIVCSYLPRSCYFTPRGPYFSLYNTREVHCIAGTRDEYFGMNDSIAARTAHVCGNGASHRGALASIHLIHNAPHNLVKNHKRQVFRIIKSLL